MAKIRLFDINGQETGTKEIKFPLLKKCNQAIYDQVVAEISSDRQGTHSTKTKAEVSGGGKKPRPQKHSGRARQGSTRNPH
jgi:large subunit ribosomal protein L4